MLPVDCEMSFLIILPAFEKYQLACDTMYADVKKFDAEVAMKRCRFSLANQKHGIFLSCVVF